MAYVHKGPNLNYAGDYAGDYGFLRHAYPIDKAAAGLAIKQITRFRIIFNAK